MKLNKPPIIQIKEGITKASTGTIIGKMIQLNKEVFSYVDFIAQLLKGYDLIVSTPIKIFKNKLDKDGWVETFGNYESIVRGYYIGNFSYLKKDKKDFGFNMEIKFWKIEDKYLGNTPRWEVYYEYNYPFQYKIDKLLKDFKDIKAQAIDGEAYSGVLLCGDEDKIPLSKLEDVLSIKICRVKELWAFLDEKLK